MLFLLPGKAPPNLSPGVPPLLPNQYIMGPGGLLPAYPVSNLLPLHAHLIGKRLKALMNMRVTPSACCLCVTADLRL